MDLIKNENDKNILFYVIGFVIGFLVCLFTLKFSFASEDYSKMITDYKLQQKEGYEFVCLYDTETKRYKLIEYADNDAYFTDDVYYVNQPYMCNLYYWNLGVWEPLHYGIENYDVGENEKLIYASSNLKDENGGVYFYATSSIITEPIFMGINTDLNQTIPQTIKMMIPICIAVMSAFLGITLIPKLLYKFF